MNDIELCNAMKEIPEYGNTAIMMVFHLLDILAKHLQMMGRHSDVPVIITNDVARCYQSGHWSNAVEELKKSSLLAKNEIRKLLSLVESWKTITRSNFSYFQRYIRFELRVCATLDKHLKDYFKITDMASNMKNWNNICEVIDFCRSSWLNESSLKREWLKDLKNRLFYCSELLTLLNGKLCFVPRWVFDNEAYIVQIIQTEMQNDPWAPAYYLEEAKNRYVVITLVRLLHIATEIKEVEKPSWVAEDEARRTSKTEASNQNNLSDEESNEVVEISVDITLGSGLLAALIVVGIIIYCVSVNI
ncbi:hypothetical protein [Encephalitozoon cuniculi GB-M1]|uniref:Uncharacterized protein n=1 Tax=Encephalitozoon cuniculi (strain GB-M1) TaxID=284813 RepID=Q8SVT9_ENCCU|nr:uncharacterized protein ECU04_0920 [Encephalitozoon cuniculi GB-M1]CAD25279.2 hypothetical protein [Encephalitozoon cuniculi GB-M1]